MLERTIKPMLCFLMVLIYCNGCLVLKNSKGREKINFIRNNPEFIKDCAAHAVSLALDAKVKHFNVRNIRDRKIRSDIGSLGNNVFVAYSEGGFDEIKDSIVTFESFSLFWGITEIVYDFAFNKRDFSNSGSSRGEYYFFKATDRIYYRRRPVPMM